ncbi:NADH-quinone oxidoreductase subunit A [Corynebacterium uterequi]|uniref:NADH-quinone oxidoreductase subunit A n=1 Tax=Corynebacterium uterequi TaxID=1072256 RepID=A0A0G3HD69_9CORY|nr:NADH-quinone oxidoreductase subunit A [Corynebacterium uterequi]AKK10620.1 NADH:ubiquinone oxidoreductase subunit 3 (chain A) [Corynebacterium uterequi]
MTAYYIPILCLLVLAAAFVAVMIVASIIIGPHSFSKAKLDVYECGVEAVDRPAAGGKMSLKYFTIAMMFIIFDVETIFLFPWAVSFDSMGWFIVVEMVLFVLTLLVAYVYVWRRGGLTWE